MAEVKSMVIRYAGGDWRCGPVGSPEGSESCVKCQKDVGDDGWTRATGVGDSRDYDVYCDKCAKDVLAEAKGSELTAAMEVWNFDEDDLDPIRVIALES